MKRTLAALPLLLVAALAIAQQGDRELFNEAEQRFQSRDYELAIDRYDALISSYPVSQHIPDAQFRKAVSLYRLNRLDEALELLDLVQNRYRSTRYLGYVPFWRGVIAYDQDEQQTALEQLTLFVGAAVEGEGADSMDPDLLNQAYLYKALAEIGTGDPAAASQSLEALLADESSPVDEPYALSLLLSLQIQAGEFSDARDLYLTVDTVELERNYSARVSLYGAEAFNGLGEYSRAKDLYRDLVDATPEAVTVAYQRLFQYAQAGRIDETASDILREAERALAGQTSILKELWLRVGIDSYNQDRFDLAELYFRRIWDLRQTEVIEASVPLYLSRLLDRRGDSAEAVTVLTEYLRLYNDVSDERLRVLVALGNLQIRTGESGAAVTTLSSAVADYPESQFAGEASFQYAYALRSDNRAAEALAAIDAVFMSGSATGAQADLLRLRARLLRETGRDEASLQALFEYLPLRPTDSAAALEYVNLLFELGRYSRIVQEAPVILSELQANNASGPVVEARLRYVVGLARLSGKAYANAINEFTVVLEAPAAGDSTVAQLLPYARYYRAFALYRLGMYEDAVSDFERMLSDAPAHAFAAKANYLLGWSYFRLGRFTEATRALARVGTYAAPDDFVIEAEYLLGRALAADGSLQQAAAAFRGLYLDYPDSGYADDAWFEYGQVQAALGSVDTAVAAFDELLETYPESELAEDAVYRRAELYLGAARYVEARDAYFLYRSLYPSGAQIDAALYWGGKASASLGESAGAILLWERLVSDHRTSPYRADAMKEAAELHDERSEYRQALNLYTELEASYEEYAQAVGAQRRIAELVLIITGLTEREAQLLVTIEDSGAENTDAGRQAIIELSQLAIYEDTATGTDASSVVPLLEALAGEVDDAPVYAAQSLFLLGEYYSKQTDFLTAAENYLNAAATSTADRDLAALSIYRAAEMYSTAGYLSEMQTLLDRLEEEFPASQWLEEARALGGAR